MLTADSLVPSIGIKPYFQDKLPCDISVYFKSQLLSISFIVAGNIYILLQLFSFLNFKA